MVTDTKIRERVPDEFRALFQPHIDSFNFTCTDGLDNLALNLSEVELEHGNTTAKVWLSDLRLENPHDSTGRPVLPTECRIGGATYSGNLTGTLNYEINGEERSSVEDMSFGKIPIMVGSKKCNLYGMSPKQLVMKGEDENECGGTFVISGNDRVIRLINVVRANMPVSIDRPAAAKKNVTLSRYAIVLRGLLSDRTSVVNTLQLRRDGTAYMGISIGNSGYLNIPAWFLLKVLKDASDREIFEKIGGDSQYIIERLHIMLQEVRHRYPDCQVQEDFLAKLGGSGRVPLRVPSTISDSDAARRLLNTCLFVHLDTMEEKFDLLVMMLRKLLLTAQGKIKVEDSDTPAFIEPITVGQVYMAVLKHSINRRLENLRYAIKTKLTPGKTLTELVEMAVRRVGFAYIGNDITRFLSTGNAPNVPSLPQSKGWSVIGERINMYRYISHFRAIHKGALFAELRSSELRRLSPDAWGFICPVHTPDGAPCGILNHLTHKCLVTPEHIDIQPTIQLLGSLGMVPIHDVAGFAPGFHPVLANGKVVGKIHASEMEKIASQLRVLKVNKHPAVPSFLEIACFPPIENGPYPGLFLATTPHRLMRPVRHLASNKTEYIGIMEQLFLDIACLDEDIRKGVTTHQELEPTNFMSFVANLTPFSDHNQSPRNVYQCQMGKQTMGSPVHNYAYRADNKLYRIQTPQTPIVRTKYQDTYLQNDYPSGTNAVVAVISYTGYDMEDAMIVNKASMERGFGQGTVYKHETVDLATIHGDKRRHHAEDLPIEFSNRKSDSRSFVEGVDQDGPVSEELDSLGLPHVGAALTKGSPMYCLLNKVTGEHRIVRYKGSEDCHVEEVRALSLKSPKLSGFSVKLRYRRSPIIGDKFSSRHGQKGTLSLLWPQEDMPFTESGMTPDIIINPHAFPSRMTIGMLIESMAAKSGALHGIYQDSTPFTFNEDYKAVDYFGDQLRKAGYNYYGSETLYSGTLGTEMRADIFFGVVYYQRLRHMVSDKFQVRATGPVHSMTHQPVKGRKRGGGVRFGEMERDALLAHGSAHLLQDRLFYCSDATQAWMCKKCGSMVSAVYQRASKRPKCVYCDTDKYSAVVEVPHVLKYLANELAAANIRMDIDFGPREAGTM